MPTHMCVCCACMCACARSCVQAHAPEVVHVRLEVAIVTAHDFFLAPEGAVPVLPLP